MHLPGSVYVHKTPPLRRVKPEGVFRGQYLDLIEVIVEIEGQMETYFTETFSRPTYVTPHWGPWFPSLSYLAFTTLMYNETVTTTSFDKSESFSNLTKFMT